VSRASDGRRPVAQPPGARESVPPGVTVLVAGGGLAGVAAACVLAERGARVTVVEREATLGGRLRTWTETLPDGTELRMERGFHAFFRQYYNVRELLRRIDPELHRLVRLADYPVLAPGGLRQSFEDLPTRPPWNVAALVRRADTFRTRDLLRVNARAALQMLRFHPRRTYEAHDDTTARRYLDSLRFPAAARRMLFDVFSHSFFNPEEAMSAAELLMMFHFYFMANPEGLVFDVLDDEFEESLWTPLRARLAERGARVRLGTAVTSIHRAEGGGWSVALSPPEGWPAEPVASPGTPPGGPGAAPGDPTSGGEPAHLTVDAVVLALSVPGLQRVVASSPDVGDAGWRRDVATLALTLPFAVWRLWLDRAVRPERPPFVGTAGYRLLDNISVYERLEAESRRWARRTGGSVVELHAYAVPEGTPEAEIRDAMRRGLREAYPETADARVVHETFRMDRDCPAFPPGGHVTRPGVATPEDGLALAGDFVRLEFPTALMERAVASGFLAANHVLRRWDVRPEPVWSVPRFGPLASRRRGAG